MRTQLAAAESPAIAASDLGFPAGTELHACPVDPAGARNVRVFLVRYPSGEWTACRENCCGNVAPHDSLAWDRDTINQP